MLTYWVSITRKRQPQIASGEMTIDRKYTEFYIERVSECGEILYYFSSFPLVKCFSKLEITTLYSRLIGYSQLWKSQRENLV